jgi:hypothetical protein
MEEEYDEVLSVEGKPVFTLNHVLNVFSDYLSGIDIDRIEMKISEFRKENFEHMSPKDISEKIDAILHNNRKSKISLLRDRNTYRKGTLFYRVRDLPESKHVCITPLPEIKVEADLWNPPVDRCNNPGRLNKKGESLLYLTPNDRCIAVEEKKIEDDDNFVVIVYEAVEDIIITPIGLNPALEGLTEDECRKLSIINLFLKDEFTRDVETNSEYLYAITEKITKRYFTLPNVELDGWDYPSVVDRVSKNVCLYPDKAKKKLVIKYFLLCSKRGNKKKMEINEKYICFLEDNGFRYYPMSLIHTDI